MAGELSVIDGLIRDHFVIEGKLFSTCLADLHKAIDRYSHAPVTLWILRHPLPLDSEETEAYISRIDKIQTLRPRVVSILSYGIDGSGTVFAAIPPLDGYPLISGNIELLERERRFTSCVELIERFHSAGIVCGDLTTQSFWVGRSGQVIFTCPLGLPAIWQDVADPIRIGNFLPYLAPEIKEGEAPTFSSDVFSLGVLGYFLLSGEFPIDRESEERGVHLVRPLKRVMTVAPPIWGDTLLLRCLEYDPGERPKSAAELRDAILEVKKQTYLAQLAPAKLGAELAAAKEDKVRDQEATMTTGPSVKPISTVVQEGSEEAPKWYERYPQSVLIGAGAGAVLLVALFCWLVFSLLSQSQPAQMPHQSESQSVAGRPVGENESQIRQAVSLIGEQEPSSLDLKKHFDEIAASNDPVAQEELISGVLHPASALARAYAEKAIIDRSARLGFKRTSEQVRAWLQALPSGNLPESYEAILRLVDPTLPMPRRVEYLKKAFPTASNDVTRITAALAFDTSDFVTLRPVLAEFLQKTRGVTITDTMTLIDMVFLAPDLTSLFGKDALAQVDKLSSEEILGLINTLADSQDSHVKSLVQEAQKRQLFSPIRSLFATLVVQSIDLTPDTIRSLVHAMTGTFSASDVKGFGSWYSVDTERTLLALCVDLKDPALVTSVFDVLAARALSIPPTPVMVPWIKDKAWERRAEFARLLGIMALSETLPEETRSEVLSAIDANINNQSFIDMLLDSAPPFVLRYIIDKHSGHIGPSQAYNLLANPDKQIRMVAVALLKGNNDVGAIQLIINRFDVETDPDVKKTYADTFWFIQRRMTQ